MDIFLANPWIAGILNFILPGSGYIYSGNRKLFGAILLLGMVFFAIWLATSPQVQNDFDNIWSTLATLFIMGGFAIDGYYSVRKVIHNKHKNTNLLNFSLQRYWIKVVTHRKRDS